MTTEVTTIDRDELNTAIRDAARNAYKAGRNWHYVRVWPGGSIVVGEEVSKGYPESEYYAREPHPVTVWSKQSNGAAGPDDGIFEWEECDHDADAEFFADESGDEWCRPDDREGSPTCTRPMRLADTFVDQCDFADDYRTAEEKLAACPWFTVEG